MNAVEELNGMKKGKAVQAIRQSLIGKGTPDPSGIDIYDIFATTKHATKEEDDKKYLAQTISHIRRRERGGKPAGKQTRGVASPKVVKATSDEMADNVTLGQIRGIESIIPAGMTPDSFLGMVKEMEEMTPPGMNFPDFIALMQNINGMMAKMGGSKPFRSAIGFLMMMKKSA